MRIAAPVLLAAAVLALTACTSAPPVEPVTAAPPPTSAPVPVPVPAPSSLPGELMRTVLTATSIDGVAGDVPPGTRDLYVHAVCTGPPGSTATYRLLDQDGELVAFSSTIACNGEESVSGGRERDVGRIRQIELAPSSSTGTEGWAVLSTSAEGTG